MSATENDTDPRPSRRSARPEVETAAPVVAAEADPAVQPEAPAERRPWEEWAAAKGTRPLDAKCAAVLCGWPIARMVDEKTFDTAISDARHIQIR